MVCAKCLRKTSQTTLATPAVKRKNDIYYGSGTSAKSAGSAGATSRTASTSATLGKTGVSKSKLLSAAAKNPYAAYASTCGTCKTKTEAGRKYCHRCAYKANACAVCGKKEKKDEGASLVEGKKFSAK